MWKWKSLSHLTLCNPMDYTVYEILYARILEWVAFPFSRGSSQLTDQSQVSHIAGEFFASWATRKAQPPIIYCSDFLAPTSDSLFPMEMVQTLAWYKSLLSGSSLLFYLVSLRPFPSISAPLVGEGNGNPLQCSCLENPRDGGAWWAAVSGVAQSRTQLKRLSSSSSSEGRQI